VMPARIALLLDTIVPGLRELPPGGDAAGELNAAVEANVRWSIHQILATPEAQARAREGVMKIVGAVYELETGRVRVLG